MFDLSCHVAEVGCRVTVASIDSLQAKPSKGSIMKRKDGLVKQSATFWIQTDQADTGGCPHSDYALQLGLDTTDENYKHLLILLLLELQTNVRRCRNP